MSTTENLRSDVEDVQQRVERDSSIGLEYLDRLQEWAFDDNPHVRYATMDIYIKLSADHPFEIRNHISVIISRLDDTDLSVRGAALHATCNVARWYPHQVGGTTDILHQIITESNVEEEQAIAVGTLAQITLLRPDLVTSRVESQRALQTFVDREDADEVLEESAVAIDRVEEAIRVLDGGDMASRPMEADLAPTPRKTWISKPAAASLKWFYRGVMLPLISVLYFLNLVRWVWRYDHLQPADRVAKMIFEVEKLKFFRDANRRTLYLRSSMWPTANQLLRLFPNRTPVSEDYRQQTDPLPDDWGARAGLIRERDGYRCRNCGAGGGPNGDAELHVDHFVPRSRGGDDIPFNLRTLCRSCHEARHARVFKS